MTHCQGIRTVALRLAGGIVCLLMLSAPRAMSAEDADGGTIEIAKEHARKVKGDLLETSAGLGRWVDGLGREQRPGWMNRPQFLEINGARYTASVMLLLLVGLFTILVVRIMRNSAGRIHEVAEKSWPKLLLSASRKPLALVLWIYGAYFSLSILFDAMDPAVGIAALGPRLTSLTYLGLTVAFFWLIFRCIKGAQKKMQIRADRSAGILDKVLVPVIGTALRLLVPAIGLILLAGAADLPEPYDWLATKLVAIFIIGSIGFLIIRATNATEKAILAANRLDVQDNLRAREIYTQVSVIRRIIVVGVSGLAVACILMLFQPVRQLGTSILASAGIAGIVLGLAAQKTLSNFFAGIQIAISQPIRIDDVVIVEGEWGRIEEIALTYVTVCIWDLRRLVLPINYFIEKPFQNWTRTSARLLNSVFLYADYTLPVEALRQELRRLLEANPRWDRDVCVLQVTDSKPESIEIRCLMSSIDAPTGWDLKCEIREGLVNFIQTHHPESLPRVRAELRRDAGKTEPMDVPATPKGTPLGEGPSAPGLIKGGEEAD